MVGIFLEENNFLRLEGCAAKADCGGRQDGMAALVRVGIRGPRTEHLPLLRADLHPLLHQPGLGRPEHRQFRSLTSQGSGLKSSWPFGMKRWEPSPSILSTGFPLQLTIDMKWGTQVQG